MTSNIIDQLVFIVLVATNIIETIWSVEKFGGILG
jgi:hypothetical protein